MHERSDSYDNKSIIGMLYQYFYIYFSTFSIPTAESLFLLVLSILAMESADSIRSLYRHFLSGITFKSLNAFYYACSHAKVDYSGFMNVTERLALSLIPDTLKSQPVFFCIDDTMIPKFGKKSEDVSKFFDHAAHNGSNYLNGHCFVSMMLCVPVWHKSQIHYRHPSQCLRNARDSQAVNGYSRQLRKDGYDPYKIEDREALSTDPGHCQSSASGLRKQTGA